MPMKAYVMGDFVTIKIFKKMLNCTKKSEIIVFTYDDHFKIKQLTEELKV